MRAGMGMQDLQLGSPTFCLVGVEQDVTAKLVDRRVALQERRDKEDSQYDGKACMARSSGMEAFTTTHVTRVRERTDARNSECWGAYVYKHLIVNTYMKPTARR